MHERVLPTVGLHLRERGFTKVFPQVTLLHQHPAVHRQSHIHFQIKEYLAVESPEHSSAAHQVQQIV